jgi:hypothetical protein
MTYPSTIQVAPAPVKLPMHPAMATIGTLSIMASVFGVILLIVGSNTADSGLLGITYDVTEIFWGASLLGTGLVMTAFWGMALSIIHAIRTNGRWV